MGFLDWLERRLEIKDDPLPSKVDVVIGIDFGFAEDGISASIQSKAIAEKCLDIFQAGIAANVILSGGVVGLSGIMDAEAMAEVIREKIPLENLFIETKSWRTYGNAMCSLEIMREQNWKSAIIVAQQWRTRRVRATFHKMWTGTGINIYVIKARSPYGGNFGWAGYIFYSSLYGIP